MGAEMLISALDKPERQAKVEAQVLAVNKSHTKELGIDWDSPRGSTGSAPMKKGKANIPADDMREDAEGYGVGIFTEKSVAAGLHVFLSGTAERSRVQRPGGSPCAANHRERNEERLKY